MSAGELANLSTEDMWPEGEQLLIAAEFVSSEFEDGAEVSTEAILAASGILGSIPGQRTVSRLREEV